MRRNSIVRVKCIEAEALPGDVVDDVLAQCLELAAHYSCVVKISFNASKFVIRKTDTVKEMLEWYWEPRSTWDSDSGKG